MTRKLTILIMLITTASLIAFDVAAAYFGDHATISQIVWDYSTQFPLIPLATGILLGHLFWARRA